MKNIQSITFAIGLLAIGLAVPIVHAEPFSLNNTLNNKVNFLQNTILAKSGDATAQYTLGSMYFRGQGVAKDDQKAFEWLSKAASKNHIKAQTALAYLYQQGLGTKQVLNQAISLYSKAAQAGDANAIQMLRELQPSVALKANSRQTSSQQIALAKQNVFNQQDINKVFNQQELNYLAQQYMSTVLKTVPNSQYNCQSLTYDMGGIDSVYCFEPVIIKQVIAGQTSNIYMLFEGKRPNWGAAPDPGIGIMLKATYQAGATQPSVIHYKENFGSYGKATLEYEASFTQLGINQYGWVINSGFKEEQNIQVFGDINNKIMPLSNPLTYICMLCTGTEALNQLHNISDEVKFMGVDQSINQDGYFPLKFQQTRRKLSKKDKVSTTTKILTIPFNAAKQQYDLPDIEIY